MSDHTPDVPQKQCSKCEKLLPATTEYFHRCAVNRDGLRYTCKPCEAQAERERQATKLERQKAKDAKAAVLAQESAIAPIRCCKMCEQEFPLTYEYFQPDKNSKGGFKPRCRKCESRRCMELRKTRDDRQAQTQAKLDAGLRQCRVCNEWKPADLEHFSARSINSTGLNSMCKACQAVSNSSSYQRVKSNPALLKEYRMLSGERAKRWAKRNPDKTKAMARSYQKRYPDKMRNYTRKRKATKAGLPSDFTERDWQFALDYFNGACAACGRPAGLFHTLAMDHWVPLSSPDCPGHVTTNVIPLCHGTDGCNNSKSNKQPEEWLTDKFGKKQAEILLGKIHDFFSKVRRI